MEIKITIQKKHLWFLVLAVVAVGFVVAFGGNNPPVMGHSRGEVQGVPINCGEPSTPGGAPYTVCAPVTWNPAEVAAYSAMAWDSQRLGGYDATNFCRYNGLNCPSDPISPSRLPYVVYKQNADNYCQGSAFICGLGSSVSGPPTWQNGLWKSSTTGSTCSWVLCDQI